MPPRKYNLLALQQQRDEWKRFCTDFIVEEERNAFEKRQKAVDMYIEGYSLKEIVTKTNIPHQKISKLVQRCLFINPSTGEQYGYSALIANKTISKSAPIKKNALDKTKGSFTYLLFRYPTLKVFIENTYRNQKGSKSLSKRVSVSVLHHLFLEECRRLRIQDYEYPFISSDQAKRTFYLYLKSLEESNIDIIISRQNDNIRQKLNSTGKNQSKRPIPLSPYSVVQIDGHKIDMLYTVEVKNRHGEIILMPATRMWLIAVVDVATRTIIGYSLTTNENYSQTDILKAIRNSIIPKVPIQFTCTGLEYPDNYGFPSLAIPETKWAMIDTIMLDNAKSHLAHNTIKKLCEDLHCSLNFGSVATPETRGIIERLFGTLEEGGYHRLPSTTGSNINDVRRKNAENDAIKYQIKYNDIKELTEYFIAIYNNSPHKALDNQTPLECMQRRIVEAGMYPSIAYEGMFEKIYKLTNFMELKIIRGNVKNGKRPYITFKGVEYRNDILSQSIGLIGQKIIIQINPDDIRTLVGYFEEGTEIGILTAAGEWGRKNHSLKTREEALRMANYNKKNHNPFYAPLSEYENELNKRAESERRSRTKAARIHNEQQKNLKDSTTIPVIPISNKTSLSKNDVRTPSEDKAIIRKLESYTKDELEAIMNADSLEDAFNKGLL